MNDLTMSLLALGAFLVAGVWTYNKLQERKYRRAAEKVFRGEQPDILVPGDVQDVEPELQVVSAQEPLPTAAAFDSDVVNELAEPEIIERREPVFTDTPDEWVQEEATEAAASVTQAVSPPSVAVRSSPPADWCDESIDLVARLRFSEGLAADDLRQAQAAMQSHQRVPLRVFVEIAPEKWLPLAEATSDSFSQAWFALQLVDRRGAISTNDFEALRNALHALASLRDGSLEFPDVAAMGEQARALDEFCAQLDLQLAIHVLDAGQGAFPGTKIRGMAEAAGMHLADSGEFEAHDDEGNFMYALANMGEPFASTTLKNLQTHGLTFLLDVPHVRDGGHAFERMLSSAKLFSNTLGAALVNAQRTPVSDAMVDSIRKKIHEIHEQMTLAGIPAGGVRALRLFS